MRRDKVTCFHINLQHSRTATSNLVQLINQHNVDITCVLHAPTISYLEVLPPREEYMKVLAFAEDCLEASTKLELNRQIYVAQ